MKREKAVTLFEAGSLMACRVIPAPMEGAGFIIELESRHGGSEALETTRKRETRIFRTVDAAANEARLIGFKNVTLYL